MASVIAGTAFDVSAELPEELLVNELLFLDSLIHWDGVVSMALLVARAQRLAVAAAAFPSLVVQSNAWYPAGGRLSTHSGRSSPPDLGALLPRSSHSN
jgi:hypothetical protein